MDSASIVIIEDDPTIASGLVIALESERFHVRHADTGEKGLALIRAEAPDLLISDIMLPGIDGMQVMRTVKSELPDLPVIMLTAKTDEIDRVMGLEMGADDYVTKPFSPRELIARVKARLRQHSSERKAPDTFSFSGVTIDLRRRELTKDGKVSRLTTHEAGTLGYLIAHRGRDVSREELLQNVWGYTAAITTRTVDNQILKLRKKLEDTPGEPRHILTVHGTGYRFEE
ncbi:MAG: response regulator transcription factor [Myxococcales bacterium]|nr:response regulator transcription factor [Myxococcales bacterium]MCB9672004.1 response regulator transcription factor [Alphaproteobacteria bacterium]MCB9692757.1 response regulator transcription factor [Alphaproteobacteria bacterium]